MLPWYGAAWSIEAIQSAWGNANPSGREHRAIVRTSDTAAACRSENLDDQLTRSAGLLPLCRRPRKHNGAKSSTARTRMGAQGMPHTESGPYSAEQWLRIYVGAHSTNRKGADLRERCGSRHYQHLFLIAARIRTAAEAFRAYREWRDSTPCSLSSLRCARQPEMRDGEAARWLRRERPRLQDRDTFFQEHRLCGDVDAGIANGRAWLACLLCRAWIERPTASDDLINNYRRAAADSCWDGSRGHIAMNLARRRRPAHQSRPVREDSRPGLLLYLAFHSQRLRPPGALRAVARV
jgi:hypothetical protein